MQKLLYFLLCMLVFTGCAAGQTGYTRMSMDEAARRMEAEDSYTLVDVRTADEYASGHIPNAINIPNENILETAGQALPDKDETILVYCRSGSRSQQAAEKLAGLGYTDVIDIGGIRDWNGDITTGLEP